MPEHVERRVLERDLQRGGDRFVLRVERLVAPARRTEQRFQFRREHRAEGRLAVLPRHLHAFRPVSEVREIQLEAPLVLQLDQRLDLANVARLAVRRKAHHLELVAVIGEAEVLRHSEVKQAERVGEEHVPVDGQAGAGHAAPRRADEIAEAVNRADRGVVERRYERGARQVSRVMLHKASAAAHDGFIQAERLRDGGRQRAQARQVAGPGRHCAFRPVLEQEQRLAPQVRAGVARHGERVDVGGGQTGHLQADGDRLVGEPRDMLDAPEPLFFDRRDELSVADERGGYVAVVRVEAEDVHQVSDAMQFRHGV